MSIQHREEKRIEWIIETPPIHTHYNEEKQSDELCGSVFCPFGFVGVRVKKTKKNETL